MLLISYNSLIMSVTKVIIYMTKSGKEPFTDWLDDLDKPARAIIRTRLNRLELGNFGDSKTIKGYPGIRELRIDYGPGYRIYFGMKGLTIVILLTGGDKKSQTRDIEKAKRYWTDYGKESL